jgi:hypothetical protein
MGRSVYRVAARRWSGGWELHIEGVGATQSYALDDAELMVRDRIALEFDVAPNGFGVEIVPELGGQKLGAAAAVELAAIERTLRPRGVAAALRRVRGGALRRSG